MDDNYIFFQHHRCIYSYGQILFHYPLVLRAGEEIKEAYNRRYVRVFHYRTHTSICVRSDADATNAAIHFYCKLLANLYKTYSQRWAVVVLYDDDLFLPALR
jgi:hypothetical protein